MLSMSSLRGLSRRYTDRGLRWAKAVPELAANALEWARWIVWWVICVPAITIYIVLAVLEAGLSLGLGWYTEAINWLKTFITGAE